MSTQKRLLLTALVLLLGSASIARAQGATLQVKEETPGLFKLAKVSAVDATKTAQARFPTATIKSGELEKEDGKLIYTFEMQQPGVTGIEEVNIDAMTGAIIAVEHENPAPPKKAAPKPPATNHPAH